MGNNGEGDAVCSANERDNCKVPVDAPGLDVAIIVRHKRSGRVLDKEYSRRFKKIREKRAAQKTVVRRSISARSVEGDNATVNAYIESCREALNSSCGVMSLQQDGLNVTFEELVNNCGQDKEVDPETDWIALTCEAIEANVEQEVQRDVQFQEDNEAIASYILNDFCVGNCTGNGDCVNGTCVCYTGYTANDCSLDLYQPVVIEGITGDGVCDTQNSDCSCIRLTTSGSVADSTYKLIHWQYDTDNGWQQVDVTVGNVVYDNFNEVFVCVEISSRKKRSTRSSTTMADKYNISLSNDGTTFSDESKVFILDTMCLQVDQENGSDIVTLSSGYCLVGGVCYADNATSPVDSCQICDANLEVFDWTQSNGESCRDSDSLTEESDKDNTVYIAVGVACAVAIIAVAVVVIVLYYLKTKHLKRVHSEKVDSNGMLYDMQQRGKFPTSMLRKDAWFETGAE